MKQEQAEKRMIRKVEMVLTALLIAAGLAIGSAQATSFDCGKAASRVEKLICGDAELSKLDEQLSTVYGFVTKETQDDGDLKIQQRRWLKVRDRCADVQCIRTAYERHIAALGGAGPYILKMSKDTTLCSAMLTLQANASKRASKRGHASKRGPSKRGQVLQNNIPRLS